MAFKENLKKFREQQGFSSAKDFAALIGVPYQNYMNYENKGSEPKYELLVKIAKALNVTPNTLLGVKDPENDLTPKEQDHMKKYRTLDDCGRFVVDKVIAAHLEWKAQSPK